MWPHHLHGVEVRRARSILAFDGHGLVVETALEVKSHIVGPVVTNGLVVMRPKSASTVCRDAMPYQTSRREEDVRGGEERKTTHVRKEVVIRLASIIPQNRQGQRHTEQNRRRAGHGWELRAVSHKQRSLAHALATDEQKLEQDRVRQVDSHNTTCCCRCGRLLVRVRCLSLATE